MKYSILPYTHTLKLNIEIKGEDGIVGEKQEEYSFLDPFIWDFFEFEEMIEEKEYMKAILFIAPSFKKMNPIFLAHNLEIILKSILELLTSGNTRQRNKKGEEGFFLSDLDFFGKRYGKLPEEIAKKVRIQQLKGMAKGVEWNNNIESDKPDKNVMIIQEQKDNNDYLEQIKAIRNKN